MIDFRLNFPLSKHDSSDLKSVLIKHGTKPIAKPYDGEAINREFLTKRSLPLTAGNCRILARKRTAVEIC